MTGSHSPVLSEENIRPSSNHHHHQHQGGDEEDQDTAFSNTTAPMAATASTKKVRLLEGDTVMKRSAMGEYVNYPPLSSNGKFQFLKQAIFIILMYNSM